MSAKIQLNHIAHVYYTHKNFDKQVQFLADFGFQKEKVVGKSIYYRGYGPEPFVYVLTAGDEDAFGGAAFAVESEEDLVLAAATLPNATPIYELTDAPGGGKCVTFNDPVDGFPMHLVYGQTMRQVTEFPERDFNFPMHKHRDVNKFQRFEKAPAPVHKLGHFGMCVTNFAKTYEFYTSRFSLVPSDVCTSFLLFHLHFVVRHANFAPF